MIYSCLDGFLVNLAGLLVSLDGLLVNLAVLLVFGRLTREFS
ncbi:hypothetical protein [Peribacillus sp. NJ4]|nr:hypothetical protein [Peribacillus sp. NJ4]